MLIAALLLKDGLIRAVRVIRTENLGVYSGAKGTQQGRFVILSNCL